MTRPVNDALRMLYLAGALAVTAPAGADPNWDLCAYVDRYNLAFSDERLKGFGNKIAQASANNLNDSVWYAWHAQLRGFIHQTRKARACGRFVGVPNEFHLAGVVTRPSTVGAPRIAKQ